MMADGTDSGAAVTQWRCRSILAGTATGPLVVSPAPFSFAGDFDTDTGEVGNPRHPLVGRKLTGAVFCYPVGRGSSSTSSVIAEAIRLGTAPAAIVSVRAEPILVVGALVAQSLFDLTLPIAEIDQATFDALTDGMQVTIDTAAGTLGP